MCARVQMDSAKMLAREVARSRKAKERILIAKTNVNSLEMQISSQVCLAPPHPEHWASVH